MKKQLLLGLTIAASSIAVAQHEDHDHKNCGHNEAYDQLFSVHPEYKAAHEAEQEAFQESYEEFMQHWSPDDRASYVVPVVVHIVHLNGPENISNEQVYDAIEKLNWDFSATNPDVGSTVAAFAGIVGNADVEFRLATKDPSGQCHSGITRTYSSTTDDTGMGASGHPIVEAVQDEHGTWPQNKYLNIFVCRDPNGAAGYTFKPGGWYPEAGMYGGIQIDHTYMGTIGTAGSYAKHTLAHEVGHWLNLNHPWGNSNTPGDPDNCDINDGVGDTPNTIGWTSCNLSGTSCGSLDNVQNIMEYSYCSTMFTNGQCARMENALNSGTAGRDNLWTVSNMNATGVNGPGEMCEADFGYSNSVICAGGSVTFTDMSYHNPTGWTWTFDGGTPATSSSANPTVTYNTSGTYTVTLQATDGTDIDTEIKTNIITVMGDPGDPVPYVEGFESLTSVSNGDRFITENENSGTEWELTTDAAAGGTKSVYLDNHGTNDGSKDNLISTPIDLGGIDPSDDVILSFDYAYKKRLSGNNEFLRFYISNDCGETWALRKNMDSDDLNTETQSSAYTPEEGDWVNVEIDNITNTHWVSNFMYKFEFTNDNGNNIWMDNINLWAASMVDLLENSKTTGIEVYPNPTNGNTTIKIDGEGDYVIDLYSTLGQKLQPIYTGPIEAGSNKIDFSMDQLPAGVYVIKVESEGEVNAIRLIKE